MNISKIEAKDLSLHYKITNTKGIKFSGAEAPKNVTQLGRNKYILALNKLNFTIDNGDRVGLVGRNGSGKSTLLRVLGGIYTPTGGVLRVQGNIASMFNINLGVQPEASGRENIILRGLVKGWRKAQIDAQMDAIIEFSELRNFIDLPLRTYSDGMRMRLLFAIATSFSPEILLLDEWIGAGDSKFQSKAADRMNKLVGEAGIVVIASHNKNLLKSVCNKAIWLDQGVMKAYGRIDEIYEQMEAANKK